MPCNRRLLNVVFSPIKRVTTAQLTLPSDGFVAAVVSAFPKLCVSFCREQSIETRSFDSFSLRFRQSLPLWAFVNSFCGLSHFGRANHRFHTVLFSICFGQFLYTGTTLVLFVSIGFEIAGRFDPVNAIAQDFLPSSGLMLLLSVSKKRPPFRNVPFDGK